MMKQLIFFLFIIISPEILLTAQNTSVVQAPAVIEDNFYRSYPHVSDVHWKQMNENTYRADFVYDNRRYNALYSIDGGWIETATPVVIKETPEPVRQKYHQSHAEWILLDIELVESPGTEKLYRFKIQEGDRIFNLIYDSQGNLVR